MPQPSIADPNAAARRPNKDHINSIRESSKDRIVRPLERDTSRTTSLKRSKDQTHFRSKCRMAIGGKFMSETFHFALGIEHAAQATPAARKHNLCKRKLKYLEYNAICRTMARRPSRLGGDNISHAVADTKARYSPPKHTHRRREHKGKRAIRTKTPPSTKS